MKWWKVLPVLASVLLVGCKEDFMTLHFDESLGEYTGRQIKGSYRQLLREAIRAQGIDLENAEIKLDRDDGKIIHIAVSNKVTSKQRDALRTFFEDIAKAREQSSMLVDMTVDAGPEATASASIPLNLEAHNRVQLMVRYNTLDWGLASAGQTGATVEIMCAMGGKLKGNIPFKPMDIYRIPDRSFEDVIIRRLGPTKHAVMTIRDSQLRELVVSGQIKLWDLPLPQLSFSSDHIPLFIELGSLGSHTIASDSMGFAGVTLENDNRYDHWWRECNDKVRQLGRPFSFHSGNTLDRLKAVTYPEQDVG